MFIGKYVQDYMTCIYTGESMCAQNLSRVAANVRARVPTTSESILSLDISTVTKTKGNARILGAHSVDIEVLRRLSNIMHIFYTFALATPLIKLG